MNKKIMDKEGLLDINCGMERDIICIGNIEDKKGYKKNENKKRTSGKSKIKTK